MSKRDTLMIIAIALLAVASFFWPTSCSAAWLDGYGACRYQITSSGIVGAHANIPLALRLDPSQMIGTLAGGTDVRITDANDSLLWMEVVNWGVDDAEIHFRANYADANSVFHVYWGNSDSTSYMTVPTDSLWINYAGVYHFNDNPSGLVLTDATGNGNHGYAYPNGGWLSSHLSAGPLGTSWNYDWDRIVRNPHVFVDETDWTVSVWANVKSSGPSGQDAVFWWSPGWSYWSVQEVFEARIRTPTSGYHQVNVFEYPVSSFKEFDVWHHWAMVHKQGVADGVYGYANGDSLSLAFDSGGTVVLTDSINIWGKDFSGEPTSIGSASQYNNLPDGFDGYVDEFRIYKSAMTTDRITSEYNNQQAFYAQNDSTSNSPLYSSFWSGDEVCRTTEDTGAQNVIPVIASIDGVLNDNRDQIKITGTNFGVNNTVNSWTGFWTEDAAVGTHPGDVGDGWSHMFPSTGGDSSRVSMERKFSGNKSWDISVDKPTDGALQASAGLGYDPGQTYESMWLSMWVYVQPQAHSPTGNTNTGMKAIYWTNKNPGGGTAPISTPTNSWQIQTSWSKSTDRLNRWRVSSWGWDEVTGVSWFEYTAWKAASAYYRYLNGLGDPQQSVAPGAADANTAGGKGVLTLDWTGWQQTGNWEETTWLSGGVRRRDETQENWDRFGPKAGRWKRWDIYCRANEPDSTGSELRVDVLDPLETWGRQTSLWAWDMHFITAETTGQNPNPWDLLVLQFYVDDATPASTEVEHFEIFLDDIYVGVDTRARVEIGNRAVYQECTELHVQPFTRWDDNGQYIEIDCNLGRFSTSQTLWAFVINEYGEVSDGFVVPKSSSGQTPREPRDPLGGGE